MSDVQKPVEETPVTAPAETTPAPVETTPEATTEPTPAVTEPASEAVPAAKEESVSKDDVKVTAQPASDGILGYKAPGLVKSFRFAKKYFWFGEEPVESKNLAHYLQNEKAEIAHLNASWATQTGKGLLFFAKRAEDKSSPLGIINLADVTDVTKDGYSNEFHFKVDGHKHTLQAGTAGERASWLVALETKLAEAKAAKEGIVGSDGYKAQLEKYKKPVTLVAPVAATKAVETTPKKSADDKDKPSSTHSASSEEKKRKDKSRSQSRKRSSIFGSLLGKKEEYEVKKEVKAEEKAEKKEEAKEEKKADEEQPSDVVADTPAAAAPAEDKKPEEPTDKKTPEPKTHKSKRGSVFGNFFQKVTSPTTEKTEKEVPPAVPAKDTETSVVAETAPQIETPVESGKPIEPESVTQPVDTAAAPKDTPAPQETGTSPSKGGIIGLWKKAEEKLEGKKETKPEVKTEDPTPAAVATTPAPATTTETATPAPAAAPVKEKRRTSLFGSLGTLKKKEKVDKDTSDAEVTDGETKHKATPTSPIPKIGNLFRRNSKAVKSEKEPAAAEPESADKPEPISKDEPTEPATNGEATKEPAGEAAPETVKVGQSSAPVPAAA